MTHPAITSSQGILGDFAPAKAGTPASKTVDEKLQKLLDKALYAKGRPELTQGQELLKWYVAR